MAIFVPTIRNYLRETVEAILDVQKGVLPVIGLSLRYLCTCHARIPTCVRAIYLTTSNGTRVLCQIPPFSEICFHWSDSLEDQTTTPLQLAVSDSIHCAASTDSLVIFSSHC